MYTSMGSSPAMLRSPLLMVFVNEVKSSHALITRFCQFWPGNSKSYVNATTMIASYTSYWTTCKANPTRGQPEIMASKMSNGFSCDCHGPWATPDPDVSFSKFHAHIFDWRTNGVRASTDVVLWITKCSKFSEKHFHALSISHTAYSAT